MLALAMVLTPAVAGAQTETTPELQLLEAYPFDASFGWQQPCYEFFNPGEARLGVLVRLETAGYSGLRTVELLIRVLTPTGEEALRVSDSLRLPAGRFEYLIEDTGLLSDPYASTQYELAVGAAFEYGPAVEQRMDVTVFGFKPPQARFYNLRVVNPKQSQNIAKFYPGDEFVLEGEMLVHTNPTRTLPVFYVSGEMANETARLSSQEPPVVTTLNWGRRTVDSPAGIWRFRVRGRLPNVFPPSPDGRQPFKLVAALRWSASAIVQAEVAGEVLDPGLGLDTSRVAHERLIVLEPAWEWEVYAEDGLTQP